MILSVAILAHSMSANKKAWHLGRVPLTSSAHVSSALLRFIASQPEASPWPLGAYQKLESQNQPCVESILVFGSLLTDLARSQPSLRFLPKILSEAVLGILVEHDKKGKPLNTTTWPNKQFANMMGRRVGVVIAHMRRLLRKGDLYEQVYKKHKKDRAKLARMDSLIAAIEEASAIEKASASLLDIGDRPRKLAKTLSACSSVSIPSLASDSTVSEEQRSGDDSCSATMDTSSAKSFSCRSSTLARALQHR